MRERGHKLRLALYSFLTLAVMVLIYYYSAQSALKSQTISDGFLTSFLGTVLGRILPRLSQQGMDVDIRKYAHMFEFFCLGATSFLCSCELLYRRPGKLSAALLSFVFCFLYACSDEWHQTFVPERGGRISDLRFDAAGILAGVALVFFIVWKHSRKWASRHTETDIGE